MAGFLFCPFIIGFAMITVSKEDYLKAIFEAKSEGEFYNWNISKVD
jgi:hypothetical protein